MSTKRRPSTSGENLYATLGLEKDCTQEDIKKAYKRMALQYHPDKNQNSPEATAKFQEINYANSVLSDETKKAIYDKYGSFGLSLADQIGEDNVKTYMLMSSCWCRALMVVACVLTGCCCCCCCCMCCNCCCGRCHHGDDDDEICNFDIDIPPDDVDVNAATFDNSAYDAADGQAGEQSGVSNASVNGDQPITAQPTGASSAAGSTTTSAKEESEHRQHSPGAAIPMPYH